MWTSLRNCLYEIAILVYLSALPSVSTDGTSNFDICDMTENGDRFKEGILGEVGEFPWLGVLRVPTRVVRQQEDDPEFAIAATGAVLITVKFVAVNADDVSKTSEEKLRYHGTVYFVPEANKTWSTKVKNLLFHPEYEYATLKTIALVELDLDIVSEEQQYRAVIKPICWPGIAFNTSNALYVTGFTDERMLLEKVLYKAQYVPKTLCDEFYKRSYLKEKRLDEPKSYVCTFSENKKKNCQWDNGMLLVSNVTGHWTIVGFGVAGPACSTPVRFIDMSAYIDWIQTSTRDPLDYDYYGGREVKPIY